MSAERIRELVLYNEMQIQLAENLNEYMAVVLTPEMREDLKELFNSLKRKILKTPSILHNIRRRDTIGRNVKVLLPNILNALIVGERVTGKSSYIKRLKHGDYDNRYLNLRTEIEPHLIYKEHSKPDESLGCYFNFRVLTNIDRDPNPQLFEHANVAFIFYSVDSFPTYSKIPEWIDKILSVVPNCKIFICASMIDKGNLYRIPDPYKRPFYVHRDVNYLQFPISARMVNTNFYDPVNETLTHFESIGLIHRTPTKTLNPYIYKIFVREESLKSKYDGLSIEEKRAAIDEEWYKSSWLIPQ